MVAMGWAVDVLKRGNASINRINEILLTQAEAADTQDAVEVEIKGRIEFKNLSFTHPNGKRVLNNISLIIPEGMSLGITGGTGSGKSTLLMLFMKIIEPSEGQIYLDGVEIRKIKRDSLRKALVFLPQETVIFSGTIRDNIAFMNPNISDQDIIEASKLVQIWDEIETFSGGLDARVGERGLSLSGGQRQRIALARAILLKPQVLILDDVLSSLDLKTESLVLRNLRLFMKGKTLIVVSSKVPSISGFDNIAVLEKGKLIELGNHEELIYMDGIYTKLYKVQTFGEEFKSSLAY
jgi:ATP-binding cassette subfamily B protein